MKPGKIHMTTVRAKEMDGTVRGRNSRCNEVLAL